MSISSQTLPDWTLAALLAGYAEVQPTEDVSVSGVTMDSRAVVAGDLFVAVSGVGGRHGMSFAGSAVAQGAVAVVYEPEGVEDVPTLDVPLIPVDHLTKVAGELASRFYFEPSEQLAVVGITGTNGKTSVSHYLAQALSVAKMPCGVVGTLGTGFVHDLTETGYTTPDAVTTHRSLASLLSEQAHAVSMEVSSHALTQHRVSGVHFDVAVFTNLSQDHLDYHGDMAAYADAKRLLLEMPGLKTAVINLDDEVGQQWLNTLPTEIERIPYSRTNEAFDGDVLRAVDVKTGHEGVQFELSWKGAQLPVTVPVLGSFNVENLLAAAGAMLALGFPLAVVGSTLEQISAVSGRMEMLIEKSKPLAIVDFAHTPDALEQALSASREHVDGTLACVFGCGGDRDSDKRSKMAAVAERLADVVIVTDDNPRTESADQIVNDILQGFAAPASVRVLHDRREAIVCALEGSSENDAVLIAGKGHESYQIVGDKKHPFSDQQVVSEWLGGVA